MNNIAIATISFAAGTVAGFILANFIRIEKEENEKERVYANDITEKSETKKVYEEEVNIPVNSPVHRDEDYTTQDRIDYSKIIEENKYSEEEQKWAEEAFPEEEDDEDRVNAAFLEDFFNPDNDEEEIRKTGKVFPIPADEWNYPSDSNEYDRQDLHYFVGDDTLTDDEGNAIDEEEFIGKKPRQFGWMNNNEDRIYIRNDPKETDFQVWKHQCEVNEWWN